MVLERSRSQKSSRRSAVAREYNFARTIVWCYSCRTYGREQAKRRVRVASQSNECIDLDFPWLAITRGRRPCTRRRRRREKGPCFFVDELAARQRRRHRRVGATSIDPITSLPFCFCDSRAKYGGSRQRTKLVVGPSLLLNFSVFIHFLFCVRNYF